MSLLKKPMFNKFPKKKNGLNMKLLNTRPNTFPESNMILYRNRYQSPQSNMYPKPKLNMFPNKELITKLSQELWKEWNMTK